MGLKSQGIVVLEATVPGRLRGKFPAGNKITQDSQNSITLTQNHLERWVGESITVKLEKEKNWVFVDKDV